MYQWGVGMGTEFYNKGANVQLGPGMCLARVPRNGRNFEYLAGEDPILGYSLVQPVIRGIQDQKVIATAKHWVLNNQETNRNNVSANADERTMFEMYFPAFAGAIEAGAGAFMCSYNRINGVWSCENPTTLGFLKNNLDFPGFVMSDWGGTHSTSIMSGLDVEMPAAAFFNEKAIKVGLADGNITLPAVDNSVFRILRSMFAVGVMDEPMSAWNWTKLAANVTSDAHVALARNLSALSTVLLKNDKNVLPLQRKQTIAVLGLAGEGAVVHGGGSGSVVPSYVVSPLEGITQAMSGQGSLVFNDGVDIAAAAQLAAKSEVAVVFAGTLSSEGSDRTSLSLDDGCDLGLQTQCVGNNHNQNALIDAVATANPNTVVVLSVPGAILMPWSPKVASVLTNFMPGQEAGHAIADVLFGDVNPSARLPLTFPNIENETEFSQEQWPGLPDSTKPLYAVYSEDLLVGYRYYDFHNLTFSSGFPFGHGLSYTTFNYSGLSMELQGSNVTLTFRVANTGKVPGAEVAQVYLSFPFSAGEPPLQLKAFQKTAVLLPDQTTTITLTLGAKAFSVWSADAHAYEVVHGAFRVVVGASSRDWRLSAIVEY